MPAQKYTREYDLHAPSALIPVLFVRVARSAEHSVQIMLTESKVW